MAVADLTPSTQSPDHAAAIMRAAIEPLLSLTIDMGIVMEISLGRTVETRRVQNMACDADDARKLYDREPSDGRGREALRAQTERLTRFARELAGAISKSPGCGGALGVKFIRNHAQDGDRAIRLYDEAMSRENKKGERAGSLVTSRKNRLTGEAVELHDAEHPDSVFDAAGGRWVTYCVAHGTLCNHRTQALARSHMAGVEWCEPCMERVGQLVEVE